jgi:integrase
MTNPPTDALSFWNANARRPPRPSRRQRLRDADVRKLPVPEKGYAVTHDSEVRGLAVRVTASGVRAFVFSYYTKSGRDRCLTIGRHPEWTCVQAREEARKLRRLVDAGGDPLADVEAERAAPTVAELCDRFEAEHITQKRASTATDYRRILKNHVRPFFGEHVKVADVQSEDIDRLHRKVTHSGAYAANRTIAVLSKMFALSMRWKMRTDNPCKGVAKNKEYHRRRYLSADELARLVKALAEHPDQQVADIVRVLLLTGARKGEALAMRWGDIDLGKGLWSKPASSTKQREHHEVPLSAPVLAILSRISEQQSDRRHVLPTYVFPGIGETGHVVEIKKGWASLLKAAGITGLRIHDLRHSFASVVVSAGGSLPLAGALLGHSQPSTTARYTHLFQDPQRAMVERVAKLVEDAGKVVPDNVVPLKGGDAS